jgi:hypothetical protein
VDAGAISARAKPGAAAEKLKELLEVLRKRGCQEEFTPDPELLQNGQVGHGSRLEDIGCNDVVQGERVTDGRREGQGMEAGVTPFPELLQNGPVSGLHCISLLLIPTAFIPAAYPNCCELGLWVQCQIFERGRAQKLEQGRTAVL